MFVSIVSLGTNDQKSNFWYIIISVNKLLFLHHVKNIALNFLFRQKVQEKRFFLHWILYGVNIQCHKMSILSGTSICKNVHIHMFLNLNVLNGCQCTTQLYKMSYKNELVFES